MRISYKWLGEYLPEPVELNKLSRILTSVGLEVESVTPYEEIKGGLEGLITGEVLECRQHPDADKLKITRVNIGEETGLQIVCGAANVAVGQKVIVATVGSTLYPVSGEPMTIKKAKIRGVESFGMICAEDEIGLTDNHEGILILPETVTVGTKASDYFKPYNDFIIEIGLTPNHMDAQSHLGVARDVVAYMNHHEKKGWQVQFPFSGTLQTGNNEKLTVSVDSQTGCTRYSGIVIDNIRVGQSPIWMQQKLKAIGLRPINNIVDITNFVLHETGQPLHAFDTEKIEGKKLFVKFLPEGTGFTGLDEKVRKLSKEDVMICNENAPMCIGGVFGGLESGVGINTRSVFLESAVFNPVAIRKSALRHDLRTDAANRFEKGVDISNTLQVLKRAALLICEIAGGTIGSAVTDIYPEPKEKLKLGIKYHYLKKLSGKNYHPETVKNILQQLNFEIDKDGIDELTVLVPHYKTDISIPADLVEEIMRIDGLDNIEIPKTISITASTGSNKTDEKLKEKVAGMLVGTGLQEIFTNSITNSAFIGEAQKTTMVKMVNNLSAELDVLRTCMLETGLQAIAYNINRKHTDLQFFEFGRTYSATATGVYHEKEHLAIYISGNKNPVHWGQPTAEADFYFTKMILEKILHTCGLAFVAVASPQNNAGTGLDYLVNQEKIGSVLQLHAETLQQFSIKSNVWHIDIDWSAVCKQIDKKELIYREVSKFPVSERDLAILVQKETRYSEIELAIRKSGVKKLLDFSLFDMFENEKLGIGKKSMAIRFTFGDPEKTLTDKEVEGFIQKILASLEKDLAAVLRT